MRLDITTKGARMWLMTTDGFFSAVQHRDEPDTLLIRARSKGDLENLKKRLRSQDSKIFSTGSADYPFRIFLNRQEWIDYLILAAEDLTYDNFKSAVGRTNPERAYIYHDVWADLQEIEHEESGARRTRLRRM